MNTAESTLPDTPCLPSEQTIALSVKIANALFKEVGDYDVHGDAKDTILVTLRDDLPKRIRLKLESVLERMQSESSGRISYIKSVGDFEALVHRKASFK